MPIETLNQQKWETKDAQTKLNFNLSISELLECEGFSHSQINFLKDLDQPETMQSNSKSTSLQRQSI